MKTIILLTILLVSFFNCATANIVSMPETEITEDSKAILEEKKPKIGLVGFYPFSLNYNPNDPSKGEPKLDLKNSLKEKISYGVDINKISGSGENTKVPSDRVKEFVDFYKNNTSKDFDIELSKIITGDLKGKDEDKLKIVKKDAEYYIMGVLGPEDFLLQENINFSTGRTWLVGITSIFSALTLGTLPSVTYRDLESNIFIFDENLYKVGELTSKSQVWMYSAW
ncbi:MAG: hypothetical protein KDK36_01325, partial [Leptospiraceae bacterium]|nr:hypothetical protein [Leptospiraceae bacterium]